VRPIPPEAFSPLTTTKSSFHASRSLGSRSATAARPARPITSPRNSIFMGLVLGRAAAKGKSGLDRVSVASLGAQRETSCNAMSAIEFE